MPTMSMIKRPICYNIRFSHACLMQFLYTSHIDDITQHIYDIMISGSPCTIVTRW
jgi:hypothetical protein